VNKWRELPALSKRVLFSNCFSPDAGPIHGTSFGSIQDLVGVTLLNVLELVGASFVSRSTFPPFNPHRFIDDVSDMEPISFFLPTPRWKCVRP